MEDDHACPTESVPTPSIFYVLRTGCHWKALAQTELCAPSTAHDRFQNGCMQEFSSSCGKQDRSNLQSLKGSIGAGTRIQGQEPSSRGAEEKPAKVPPVVGR